MSKATEQDSMSSGRALLTDRERAILAGEADVKDNYRYKVESNVRQRLKKFEDDLDVLEEHYPEMYEQLRSEVCDNNE